MQKLFTLRKEQFLHESLFQNRKHIYANGYGSSSAAASASSAAGPGAGASDDADEPYMATARQSQYSLSPGGPQQYIVDVPCILSLVNVPANAAFYEQKQ